MSGTYGAPPPPPSPSPAAGQHLPGPVRSPRGLVDVTVEPQVLVLRSHDSWRTWVDSELLLALVAVVGVLLAVVGAGTDGPAGTALLVLGALLFVPVVLYLAAQYVAVAWFAVRTAVLVLSGGGRDRLKREVADVLAQFGEVELGWRIPRGQMVVPPAADGVLRARLRLETPQGTVTLRVPWWRRSRLEAVRWALAAR